MKMCWLSCYEGLVESLRLFQQLTDNGLHEKLQSAYKPLHSTDIALMRVQYDITSSVAGSSGVLLVLLDLSAAFDTIDASIPLKTINDHFGIFGSALTEFSSYVSDRTQRVQIWTDTSNERPLRNGVPQGSVLGPMQDIFNFNNIHIRMIINVKYVFIAF